jgi:NADH:ubiquinone oxidoreductase subunit 5 (subunit L)/multisubunit Na+/H+ antiporter MnhA subunit
LFSALFLGEPKTEAREGTPSMLMAVIGLAALSVLAGIFIRYPMEIVNTATLQILGRLP